MTANDAFFATGRLRAGWRILLFLLLFAVCVAAVFPPVLRSARGLDSLTRTILLYALGALASVFSSWIVTRFVDRRPLWMYGLAPMGGLKRFAVGLLCGFLSISLLIALLILFRVLHFEGLAITGMIALRLAGIHAVLFLLVGFTEEYLTRGYLLFALTQGIGFWPAATVLSILFAAGHIHNRGEDAIGIVAAALIGLLLAWSVKHTGSLWWAMGYHSAWDWGESYFYGVPDSGGVLPGHLMSARIDGPFWLSGGATGPEGSVLILPVVCVLAWVVYRAFPYRPPVELELPTDRHETHGIGASEPAA